MKEKEKIILMFYRRSIFSIIIIGIFWTTWYGITGEIPSIVSLKLTKNWEYILPFKIYRWWDMLIGPIWSIIVVIMFKKNKIIDYEFFFIIGISIGLFIGFFLIFNTELVTILSVFFFTILIVNTLYQIDDSNNLKNSFNTSLIFGLGASLSTSLIAGLVYGFFVFIVMTMSCFCGIVLNFIFKTDIKKECNDNKFLLLIRKKIRKKITKTKNWLSVN